MPFLRHGNISPTVHPSAFVAPGVTLVGDVVIGASASLWFGVVARGDINDVRIGQRTNIQDGTVIHVSSTGQGTHIGDDVTVGHMAVIHACTLENACFVGIKACVMDDAVVQSGAMVAAGALVTPGKVVPAGELWAGVPARYARRLKPEEVAMIHAVPGHYVELARRYMAQKKEVSDR